MWMNLLTFLIAAAALIILLTIGLYQAFLLVYMRRDNHIDYSFLSGIVKGSSPDNYYLNYGYWADAPSSLKEANANLAKLLFERCAPAAGSRLLDVGCGFGRQDLLWLDLLRSKEGRHLSSSITAIDIGTSQIEFATKERIARNIPKSQLNYIKGDALSLDSLCSEQDTYTHVLSLESAFHYANRPRFFENAYGVLEDEGRFVISDIVLEDNPSFSSLLFASLYAHTLAMPRCNLIPTERWKASLREAGFVIESFEDITDSTFQPYYKHTLLPSRFGQHVPTYVAQSIRSLFTSVQPFRYVLAVCRKSQPSKNTIPRAYTYSSGSIPANNPATI